MKESVFEVYSILLLHWKQTYRRVLLIGVVRMLILVISSLYLLAAIYTASEKETNVYRLACLWGVILFLIHVKRVDRKFLHIHMNFAQWICGIEYIILSLPIMICFLMHQWWLMALSLLSGAFAIGFIKIWEKQPPKQPNTCMQAYIPHDAYEWKAGVRKYLYAIITVCSFGLCLSFFTPITLVAIGILGLLIIDFYDKNESWQMLISCQKSANRLLYYKLKQHLLLFTVLILPLIVAFLFFHPELWYILFVEYIVVLSIHVYSIILKYAFYSHDRSTINYGLLLIGVWVGLIPVTTPLLWIFSVYLFRKACTNLNLYLNDYY
jgi:hypothetical protein